MSLKHEPASEPLHIPVKQLFLDCELYRKGRVCSVGRPTGVPHLQENAPPKYPIVSLCLASKGGGRFLMGKVTLYFGIVTAAVQTG